ncbi:MAG: InlB B-repeat-containing protein, partial [Clostridia bacterium]|nr:InlB B-repeat-containing protein [Clostridia bacterium]
EELTVENPACEGLNFLGYKEDATIPATMPVGGAVVEAAWEVIAYTVKVIDFDGAETVYTFGIMADVEAGVEYSVEELGEVVVLPELPTAATGYTNAWDVEIPETWALQNYEFKMVATTIVYTITFECEVGEVEAITFTVETYDDIVLPAVPEKEGFTGKWNKTVDQLLFADVTLTAVYEAIPEEKPDDNSTGSEDVDSSVESSDTALPGEDGIVDKVKDMLSGCGSVVGGIAGGVAALGLAVVALLKKKED